MHAGMVGWSGRFPELVFPGVSVDVGQNLLGNRDRVAGLLAGDLRFARGTNTLDKIVEFQSQGIHRLVPRFRARKMLGEDAVAVVRRFISQAGDVELPAKEGFARRDYRGHASGEIDRRESAQRPDLHSP